MSATKTPWRVGGKDDLIIYGNDGYAIANAVVYHGRTNIEDMKAIAKLIAAAPELLEALKIITHYKSIPNCHQVYADGKGTLCGLSIPIAAIENAIGIITKATN